MFGTRTLRPLSAITLFFFLWTVLYPAVSAAVAADTAPSARPAATPPEPDTLESLRSLAHRAHAKTEAGADDAAEASQLLQHAAKLGQEQQQAEAEFAATRQHLEDHKLPDSIKQRHAQALKDYRANMQQLRQQLKDFKAAHDRKDAAAARRSLKKLAQFLDKAQKHRHHQPFDPNNLPFGAPSGKTRAPKESQRELDELVHPPKPIAANTLTPGMLANDPGPTPTAADLAATEDAPLTDAIKAQATALHNNPVEIYNWVRNTVEFLPTYGSIQGADLTLQTQRGNAFDTASLLVALLRAANIPARYAYGTVQIPAAQVMNWVGGVTSPEAAQSLLGQGGIPNTAVVSGGRISAFKLEHVWVEAFVDYFPSRGAVNKAGDTWAPMDAAFKQYDYQNYVDLRQDAPFNAQAFADVFTNGSTSNLQEGWVSYNNIPALQTAYQQGLTDIHGWIDRLLSNGKDWRRLQKVVRSAYPILLGSLPYTVVAQAAVYSAIPEQQRCSFNFSLYANELDRSVGQAILSYRTSLPALAAQRLTLGFAPATDADWAVIKSYLPKVPQGQVLTPADLPSILPGNLIRLNAVLLKGEEPIMRGGSFSMGQDVFSTTAISRLSGGFQEAHNAHIAGEFLAIGIDLQGYGDNQLRKSANRTTVSVLHQAAQAYFYRRDLHLQFLRLLGQAAAYPAPSFGLFGTNLTPRYRFGIPTQVKINGVQVDVDASLQTLVPLDNDAAAKIRLTGQLGMALSATEHEIPESYLANDQYPGEGASAIKALSVALGQGQRLYRINAANLDAALAHISLTPEIEADIRNAVNAGQEAQVHESPVTISGWTGAGYILTDPQTGAGAYRIAGGLNGGAMEADMAESLEMVGLKMLMGSAETLVDFAIPAASADDGICGEAEKEQVKVSDFAVTLIFIVLVGFVVALIPLPPAIKIPLLALAALFTAAEAVAQARKDQCYVYYLGNSTPDGKDISALAGHILGAISAKQSAHFGMGIANLNYTPSAIKVGTISRQWYNSAKPGCGPIKDRPAGTNCDEYPFFSSIQGGPAFYPDGVSLQSVNAKQNRDQGSTLGAFYRACFGFTPNTAFVVQPSDSGATYGAQLTRDGKNTCWPRSDVPVYIPLTDDEEELLNN